MSVSVTHQTVTPRKPQVRLTAEELKQQYLEGGLAAWRYLYLIVRALRKDGHKLLIRSVKEFCQQYGFAERTFYRSKARLVADGSLNEKIYGVVELWVDPSATSASCGSHAASCGSHAASCGSEATLEPLPDKDSSDSSTLFYDLSTLSHSANPEREDEFFDQVEEISSCGSEPLDPEVELNRERVRSKSTHEGGMSAIASLLPAIPTHEELGAGPTHEEMQSIPTHEEVKPEADATSQPKQTHDDQCSAPPSTPMENELDDELKTWSDTNLPEKLKGWSQAKIDGLRAYVWRRAQEADSSRKGWFKRCWINPLDSLIAAFEKTLQTSQPNQAGARPANPLPPETPEEVLQRHLGCLRNMCKQGRWDQARNEIASNPQWGIVLTNLGPEPIS